MSTAHALTYAPVLTYLAVVTTLVWSLRRVPVGTHVVALGTGLICGAIAAPTWLPLLGQVAVGGVAFVALVAVASRTLGGVTVFVLPTALAMTPFEAWAGIVTGLALALVVSVTALMLTPRRRVRVWWLLLDTAEAMGWKGTFQRPDISLMPRREELDINTEGRFVPQLAPWLALGLVLDLVVSQLR